MATFARVNPVSTTTNYEVVGRDISFFTVNYAAAVNNSAGPAGAQAAVLQAIMQMHTIICVGPLIGTNAQQTFAIEGPLYTPSDVTLISATYLQDLINGFGVVDTINLASATVTATNLGILYTAAV